MALERERADAVERVEHDLVVGEQDIAAGEHGPILELVGVRLGQRVVEVEAGQAGDLEVDLVRHAEIR